MTQRVTLHGDLSHTTPRSGADCHVRRKGLGEATSFVTPHGRHILVDAGDKGSALHRKLCCVDVLLLTHNDCDHVGGAPELLESAVSIREVWLPYDWYLLYTAGINLIDAIRDGNNDLQAVAGEARGQVAKAVAEMRECLTKDESTDGSFDRLPPRIRDLRRVDEVIDSLTCNPGVEVLRAVGEQLDLPWIGGEGATASGVTSGGAPGRRARATVHVVDAVLRWYGSVKLGGAIRWGGFVRWFSIDHASASFQSSPFPWQSSGYRGEFTIVNAFQVDEQPLPQPPTPAIAYVQLVARYLLTVQNRRALVALGHVRSGGGHVLFASDSSFEFDRSRRTVPWEDIGAVVGLHHGSANKEHDHVYSQLPSQSRHVVLARSGSGPTTRTHPKFKHTPAIRRGCTWCHADERWTSGHSQHRDVVLELCACDNWHVIAGACVGCPQFG